MARRTHDIIFGVSGQAVAYRVAQGRPSSATFKVFRDITADDGEAEFSGDATVDSVSTSLSDSAGASNPNPRRLVLEDGTGVRVGRKYLLSEGGRREWIEPLEVDGGVVIARHALRGEYFAGASFESTYIEADIDDDWAADEDHLSDQEDPNPDYRIRWEISFSESSGHVAHSYFDLVRTPGGHGVTFHAIDSRWPGLMDALPYAHEGDRGQSIIDSAWRAVRGDIDAGAGLNDAAIRKPDAVDEAVILRVGMQMGQIGRAPGGIPPADFAQLTQAQYERHMERHFYHATGQPVAEGTGGGASFPSAVPRFVK